jgi:hypothetical protein
MTARIERQPPIIIMEYDQEVWDRVEMLISETIQQLR